MGRLTKISEAGNAYYPKCFEEPCCGMGECLDDKCGLMYEVCKKLAEYEQLEEQGLLVRLPCKEAYTQSGDCVYLIDDYEIIECAHCGLGIDPLSGKAYIALATNEKLFPYRSPDPEQDLDPTDWCTNTTDVEASELGKTVFLTREEAEKKLEEMKTND